MATSREEKELSQKANLALDQFDCAVLDLLILLDRPLFPYEITDTLELPNYTHPGEVSHITVRASLFRLLDKDKVKRGSKNAQNREPWLAV